MTLHRRISSPSQNSKIMMGSSDIRTIKFPKYGGAILGMSRNRYENIRFFRSGSGFLDIASGDDVTIEGNPSSDRITIGIKSISVGSSSSTVNNVRFHHSGNKELQFVLGNDATVEGSQSSNLAVLLGLVPFGTIVFWLGGYFLDSVNGSYNYVLGSANTISDVNTYTNYYGWYVCDGSSLNLSKSPIFNGGGRYLPNISDSRFLSSYTVVGGIGGDNSNLHTHDVTPQTSVSMQPSFTVNGHYHGIAYLSLGSENQNHSHGSGSFGGNTSYSGDHTHNYESWDNGNFYDPNTPGGAAIAQGGAVGAQSSDSGLHTHSYASINVSVGGVSATHNHTLSGTIGYVSGQNGDNLNSLTQTASAVVTSYSTTSNPSTISENRPKYLSGFYLMRVF